MFYTLFSFGSCYVFLCCSRCKWWKWCQWWCCVHLYWCFLYNSLHGKFQRIWQILLKRYRVKSHSEEWKTPNPTRYVNNTQQSIYWLSAVKVVTSLFCYYYSGLRCLCIVICGHGKCGHTCKYRPTVQLASLNSPRLLLQRLIHKLISLEWVCHAILNIHTPPPLTTNVIKGVVS